MSSSPTPSAVRTTNPAVDAYDIEAGRSDAKAGSQPSSKTVQAYHSGQAASVSHADIEHENLHEFVKRARNVSLFSIVFTLVCSVVGLAFAWSTKSVAVYPWSCFVKGETHQSSALLGYALEALVDVWSSILVLWRFWKDPDGEGHYFLITRRRESRASVGIAFTFVVIGACTSSLAIVHLAERQPPANSEVLLAISGTSIIILTWSCATKLSLSKVLQSSALRKDAITSGACACMAGAILISTSVHKSNPSIWWLDACVAVVVSCVLGVLGVRTLVRNPWWTREFWSDSKLPPEEKQAAHIMEMPFSPRVHGRQEMVSTHVEMPAYPASMTSPRHRDAPVSPQRAASPTRSYKMSAS